jgi:histidyl-tRNA synthetase
MIYSHEIPKGANLYFSKTAKLKREIEAVASEVFENEEYEEICTPFFSYHQQEALSSKELIRLHDRENRELSLRADSSIDVIRLVIKRLKSNSKKWFYIQPVFRYPSNEINQIGMEYLEANLSEAIRVNRLILDKVDVKYTIQISNINIVKLVEKLTDFDIEDIKKTNVEKLSKVEWLKKLLYIHTKEDLEDLTPYPKEIQEELLKIKNLASDFDDVVISPLFFANFNYYDGLFFRIISGNELLSMGGEYEVENQEAVGFSIYTDSIIELKEIDG